MGCKGIGGFERRISGAAGTVTGFFINYTEFLSTVG